MRSRFFLGEIVDYVMVANSPYYHEKLSKLIPDKLLDTALTGKNQFALAKRLDKIRFKKEKEFAATLTDPDKLCEILNSPLNSLPAKQEQKRKEIKFLFNVGATLLHW
jgi:hypothetical protein